MSKLEDLLRIAKSDKPSTLEVSNIDDVEKFVRELKIRPGKNRIKTSMLFKAYVSWSAKPYEYMDFLHKFCIFFPKSKDNSHRLNFHPVQLLNKVDNLKVK